VLLLRSGIQRIALHVDELIGNEENRRQEPRAAARPPARRRWRDGACRRRDRADHEPGAARRPRARRGRPRRQRPVEAAPAAVAVAVPAVMVVDDSLTVRKITSRLLEREGYRVLLAKDGRRRPRADEGLDARRAAGRHRNAAHGRLRPDAQRARR